MKRKTDRELKRLFGDAVVFLADITDPVALDLSAALMDRVHDGAHALLGMRGNQAEQQRYIGNLPFEVRFIKKSPSILLFQRGKSIANGRVLRKESLFGCNLGINLIRTQLLTSNNEVTIM